MNQDILVGLMTRLRERQKRERGSISSKGKRLLLCLNCRTVSRACRSPNTCSACGGAFPRFKRLRRKIYHSFPYIAQTENEWTCTITYPYAFIARTKIRFPFTD